ncbi:MAG: hypothetical protein ACYCZY_02705 [Lacisediminihabitans sp.]
MSRGKKQTSLVVGGEPRVSLLPPEFELYKKVRVLRRRLVVVLVLAVVLVGAGYGVAAFLAAQSQQRLDAENGRTATILAEQAKYKDVSTVWNQLAIAKAARQVGSSTEIDLAGYLEKVQATLPANTTIVNVSVDAASPMKSYPQATVPLQPTRIATLTFTASTSMLPNLPSWLTALATLPGFTDATPGTIKLTDAGLYQADVKMHVDENAFAKRFYDGKGGSK